MFSTKPKSTILLKDVELERKKEFERRKKLRLQQVRQQSKDLAYSLREKIRLEKCQQQNVSKQQKYKQLKRWQEEKLGELQEIYKCCLRDVGQSHIQAAKQPDVVAILAAQSKINLDKAMERGFEATQKKKIEDEENHYKKEAPLIHKQLVRTKEDIRSVLVSSLPPPVPRSSLETQLQVSQSKHTQIPSIPESQPKRVLQEIPSNIPIQVVRTENTNKNKLKFCENNQKENIESENENPRKDKIFSTNRYTRNIDLLDTNYNKSIISPPSCTDCGYVCCCHEKSSISTNRRRCFSESYQSTNCHESDYDSDSTWPPRTSPCSQQQTEYSSKASVVKFYDHPNRFRKKYNRPVNVMKHSFKEPDVKSYQDAKLDFQLKKQKEIHLKQMTSREKKRSKLAFYKEKIIKEFDELGQELEALCREEMNIKNRARHLTIKKKQSLDVKQKKMEEAFLKSQKQDIITEAQSSISDEVEEPNIWNVSTQNHPRNNSPTDTAPAQWSDQTDLQEILDRLEKRSKEMLEKLSFNQSQEYPGKLLNPSTSATSKTSSVKLVEKQVHISPKDKSAPIQLTERSIVTSNENDDKSNQIQKKISTDNLPKINVELNKSTIDLNVVGLDQTKKNTYTGSYDGVTVTVRLNKNSSKIKKDKSNLKYSGYETTSSAYCSPPDQIVPPKKPIIDDLIKTVGKINNLKPFIIKLLGMSRESVEEITRTNKERSIIEEHSKIISAEDELVHSNNNQDLYNQYPQIEHLKSLHDSLTEKYMEKLQQISQHYENLLSSQVSPADFDHKPMPFGNISPIQTKPKDYFNQSLRDILDEMDHQTVVSTESSYNRLPADIENNEFPIHQEAVATQYKMYPKADQTFQEFADLMVAQSQKSGLFGLPQSISPKPPNKDFSLEESHKRMSSWIDNRASLHREYEEMDTPPTPEIPSHIRRNFQQKFQNLPPQTDLSESFNLEDLLKFEVDSPIVHELAPDFQENVNSYNSKSVAQSRFTDHTPTDFQISSNDQHKSPTVYNKPFSTPVTKTTTREIKINSPQENIEKKEITHKSNIFSFDELELDLAKMGIGWAGATLRKTREAAELSPDSSSSKNESYLRLKYQRQNSPKTSQDRSMRTRVSTPINLQSPPRHMFSSSDDVNNSDNILTKKTKKSTEESFHVSFKNLFTSRTTDTDLTPPELGLKPSSLESPKY